MQKLLFLIAFSYAAAFGQPVSYSTANAHSHNDYLRSVPLLTAYYAQFGSIEVDVFLENDELLVAHTPSDFAAHRTLEDMYLKPLVAFMQKNNGYPYADSSRKLQLMIDIKTDASSTMNQLIMLLQNYPQLTENKSFRFVITGNRPDQATFATYPSYIWFDGLLSLHYTKEALTHVAMLSENFLNYSTWRFNGPVPDKDWERLQKMVDKAHTLGKAVRFWNTPDNMDAWQQLIQMGVDYINTDSPKSLAAFLKTARKI